MAPTLVSLGACQGLILLLLTFHADAQLNNHIGPAVSHVAKDSAAGVELFSSEAIQLTESGLVELNEQETLAQYAALFDFGNSSTNHEELLEGAEACKTYPGDDLWPSAELWEVFSDLLGGALSPITPIASSCYEDSAYDDYDASLCASVSEGWTKEITQSVTYSAP